MDNKLTEYALKRTKKRDKELKYDFMPSLLEIIERPSHKAGTIIILGIFTLLIATIIWACLSELDVVITASGNIQPIGSLNKVQSYTSGTVKAINVQEGTYVNEGDVLIELDIEALEIDVEQLNEQKELLLAQKKMYLITGRGIDISKFSTNGYPDDTKPYIQAIIDSDTSYRTSLANLEKEKENADLNKQIAQVQLEQYESYNAETETKKQELLIRQYDVVIEQLDLQITNTKIQYSIQVNSQLSQINSKLEEINAQLEKYKLSTEYQNITAPVSGYINSINVNTLGAAVTSAQELVTIVPDDAALEMICYVKNMDIADVKVGMEAELKLEAYPYSKCGTVKGIVKYISPSAFTSEQHGSVYIVKLNITDYDKGIDIISGLSGTVEIKTAKRTVMEYFLEPIIKGFGESLKEK